MSGVLYCWKSYIKVRAAFYFVRNTKIRYNYGFILLKVLKLGTAQNLFHWKDQNKLKMEIYFI